MKILLNIEEMMMEFRRIENRKFVCLYKKEYERIHTLKRYEENYIMIITAIEIESKNSENEDNIY